MAEVFHELSAVQTLVRAGITQGFDPCKVLEELIARIDNTLEENPQDAGAIARRQEAKLGNYKGL